MKVALKDRWRRLAFRVLIYTLDGFESKFIEPEKHAAYPVLDAEAGKAKQAKEDAKMTFYDRSYYREKGSIASKEEPLFNHEVSYL